MLHYLIAFYGTRLLIRYSLVGQSYLLRLTACLVRRLYNSQAQFLTNEAKKAKDSVADKVSGRRT